MSISDISRALAALDHDDATRGLRDGIVIVSNATKPEWNTFVESEEDLSYRLEWVSGANYVVELHSREREFFVAELEGQIRSSRGAGASDGARYLREGRQAGIPVCGADRLPDTSFLPDPATMVPLGDRRPQGVAWGNFRTLIVEVGFARTWGRAPCDLDWKANEVWAIHPGVRYVLCIAVGHKLETCSHKLYEVVGESRAVSPSAPIEVAVGSNTTVRCRLSASVEVKCIG